MNNTNPDISLGATPPDHWCRAPGWTVVAEVPDDELLHISWRCGCGFTHRETRRVVCQDKGCVEGALGGGKWCEPHLAEYVRESRRKRLETQRVQYLHTAQR